jgi:hypothetical protein
MIREPGAAMMTNAELKEIIDACRSRLALRGVIDD